MKNTVSEIENVWGKINSRLDPTEEKSSELQYMATGTIQVKQKSEERWVSMSCGAILSSLSM